MTAYRCANARLPDLSGQKLATKSKIEHQERTWNLHNGNKTRTHHISPFVLSIIVTTLLCVSIVEFIQFLHIQTSLPEETVKFSIYYNNFQKCCKQYKNSASFDFQKPKHHILLTLYFQFGLMTIISKMSCFQSLLFRYTVYTKGDNQFMKY